jgi:hypothetical protein
MNGEIVPSKPLIVNPRGRQKKRKSEKTKFYGLEMSSVLYRTHFSLSIPIICPRSF